METVQRFDVGRMGKVRRTSQGFLEASANLTRTGVFEYRRKDGTIRRELRLPEEVFRQKSLDTLKGAPLTDQHSAGMVSPSNVRDAMIGMVRDDVRRDGNYVASTVVVQNEASITDVLRGKRREVSAGYNCALEMRAGEHEGQKYDCIQRGIVYNHVGIGPTGWGRAGSDVAMHLDGDDDAWSELSEDREDANQLSLFIEQQRELLGLSQIEMARQTGIDEIKLLGITQGFDTPTDDELKKIARLLDIPPERLRNLVPARRDGPKETNLMKTITIHLDGVDFEVQLPSDSHASDFQARLKRQDTIRDEAVIRADKAEADLKAKGEKLDKADAELTKVKSPEHIQERISARVDLEDRAGRVLPEEDKIDGKSDREVMDAVLGKAAPDTKLDGKSDDEVKGIFDYVTDQAASDEKPAPKREGRQDGGRGDARTAGNSGSDDKTPTVEEARDKMRQDGRDAWKKPLRATNQTTN